MTCFADSHIEIECSVRGYVPGVAACTIGGAGSSSDYLVGIVTGGQLG